LWFGDMGVRAFGHGRENPNRRLRAGLAREEDRRARQPRSPAMTAPKPAQPTKAPQAPKTPKTLRDELEARLDEALEESFPASDSIAVDPIPRDKSGDGGEMA
jgi:hypothetical protein